MYGQNYGIVRPQSLDGGSPAAVGRILSKVRLAPGGLVLDIGSNDATLLTRILGDSVLVGVDPTGAKLRRYYPLVS